jgi:hypothetical protein
MARLKLKQNLMRATAAYLTAHCSICQHGDASTMIFFTEEGQSYPDVMKIKISSPMHEKANGVRRSIGIASVQDERMRANINEKFRNIASDRRVPQRSRLVNYPRPL